MNGWYTSDVQVSWAVSDNESTINSSSGCEMSTVTVDTDNISFTCSATSSGGTNSQTVRIKRDATPPSNTVSANAEGSPYNSGTWTNKDVKVTFNCGDPTSGVSVAPSPTTVSNEGANQLVGGTCTDYAGNSANATFSGIDIDKTPPIISVSSPVASNYELNIGQFIAVQFVCTDARSGIATCPGTQPSGSFLDTSSVGSKTFTVNAADQAGNSAVPSVTIYNVHFDVEILFDQGKAYKSGSTIPIKLRLVDVNGSNFSNASTIVHAVSIVQTSSQATTSLEAAGNGNQDLDFRYDAALGGYIFNLKTAGYSTGTYVMTCSAAGGSGGTFSFAFQVRK